MSIVKAGLCLVCGYLGLRFSLPPKVLTYDTDRELLSVITTDMVFATRVTNWYDVSIGCFPISSWYWQRVKKIRKVNRDGSVVEEYPK
jgi:hypothetical protein